MYTDYTDEDNSEYNEYYNDENGGNNVDKEKIKKIAFFVIAFVILVVIIIVIAKGCSNKKQQSNVNPNSNQTPSIVLSRESYSLEEEEEVEIYADILASSVTNPIVGWQTEDSTVATVEDTGDGNAVIKGIKEGKTAIVAVYRENGKVYTNRCEITVTSKTIEATNIDIVQSNITLAKGKDILLQIKITPSDAKVDAFEFSSDNSNIASVDEDGRVYALRAGTTTITAKTTDGKLSDSMTVTVVDNTSTPTVINPTGVQLMGLSNGLKVGGTADIKYSILPTNATNKQLTWKSSNTAIATVDSNGKVKGIKAGKVTITATTTNGITGSIDVTVESNTVAVTGITVNGDTALTVKVGTVKLISYTISPSNATNKKVKFSSNNSSVVTVNSNGMIGALKAGTAVISITTEDGNKTANITVTVTGNGTISGSTTSNTGDSIPDGNGGSSSDSSSSGTTTEDSSSSSSASCTASLMTNITHNGSGAIISQYSFGQAKAFQNMGATKPIITVKEIEDCINKNKLTYQIYHGTTESNISTTSYTGTVSLKTTGTKITLNKGDGYYKVVIKGYLKDNSSKYLTKTYYAIVKNNDGTDTIKPYINSLSVSKTSSTKLLVNAYVNETGSGLKNIKYCLTATTSCTPNVILYSWTSNYPKSNNTSRSSTITNASLGAYKRICVMATDVAGNESASKCYAY